ncbi:hypothetical protein BKA82DRAFT_170311 [Pisolithus tinctorius]|uniref:Uncharacterized protein n=1 Tax=Pisolithus tinctorius Marx 270 TaxID=870435 RepID=A0A0C3MXX3_PISTI|nr:hypothetical protein BKA82DRAFT_170311 [Pisolithus tinctorius]KIN93754.1 hypothetical protein M404DRAFT_170311 [Pisolithus tinctorius Marx 270]
MNSFLESCQAVVCLDVKNSDTETAYLQPLVFTVCFPGPMPRSLTNNDIPVQISVSLSEAFRGIILPEVRPGTWCADESEHPLSVASVSLSSSFLTVYNEIPITFLPLPPLWNPMDTNHWLELSKGIERWLVDIVQVTNVPEWTWGRDVFWLAYIGAYSAFPCGKWEPWNPIIPLEGQFIEEWLAKEETDNTFPRNVSDTLSYIWNEFCRHAVLFYPFPLLVSN